VPQAFQKASFFAKPVCNGKFGYLRIFSFQVDSVDAFVNDIIAAIQPLPRNGLIIDVRDNVGGHIEAGERLLQIFGRRRPIEPERLYFINTPLTLRLCELQRSNVDFGPKGLKPWCDSITRSGETGATFSASFPKTDPALCNKFDPTYNGPVILVTNALSYSATEYFAAGFQDHDIGKILGVDESTGGGGANVRPHEELRGNFMKDRDSPFRKLPKGSGLTVALRRSQRVGGQAGNEVEDFGVARDCCYRMTRRDLLERNSDLIEHAAKLLAGMRTRATNAQKRRSNRPA
jgi:C-terminal processing protease CtpA/Prc